jgi:hypothetical protein
MGSTSGLRGRDPRGFAQGMGWVGWAQVWITARRRGLPRRQLKRRLPKAMGIIA